MLLLRRWHRNYDTLHALSEPRYMVSSRQGLCSNGNDVIFFAAKKMTSLLLHISSRRRHHVARLSHDKDWVCNFRLCIMATIVRRLSMVRCQIIVFLLESRSFEKTHSFEEEQKIICAIIELVLGHFFQFRPSIWLSLSKNETKF